MKKILLAEDEEHIRYAVKMNLELEGYSVTTSDNGADAVALTKKQVFDLVILDIMLPGTDGFEACKLIKQQHPSTPILFLTALSDSANRIQGLKLADDYLPKPFNLEELILRVKNLLKRAPELQSDIFSFDTFEINFRSFEIKSDQKIIETLSQRECQLLKILTNRVNEVVSRDEILEKLWGPDENPSARTIDNYILNFRKIFEKNPKEPVFFHSIRGVGYKFSDSN
ncbi:MAG TPA: response regulator transcription factor [Bacteroidia bacterium]|jgi:two-component system alkaline phosphatase synthesis response regulator PhoP|nr:response regulator transcription factor [Bacteroidia bacterium]